MSAFAAAIDDLFADPNLANTALWRIGGVDPPIPIRVIARRPDQVLGLAGGRVHTPTAVFDVRVSEVATPRAGDTLEVDGVTYVLQGEPVRESERLVWRLDTYPA